MGIHDGHRKRTKERVLNSALESVDDHVLLEVLLYYAVPRLDTNVLAHKLIEHFGSIVGVLEADFNELKQVDGIGDNAAFLISLVTKLNKRYHTAGSDVKKLYINDTKDAGIYFKNKYEYETVELIYAAFLDSSNGIIKCEKISQGVVNASEISIRQLVEAALKYKASYVIISHNHPNTLPYPSREDEICTEKIRNALKLVGIELLDHIIVGQGKYISINNRVIM